MSDMLKMDESNVPPLKDIPLDLSHEQDLPESPLTASSSLFERVRFNTVGILSFDGYEETFDIAILNLSQTGVACTGPRGMVPKDRLRLSFRLQLGGEMESFLCEVVWVKQAAHDPERSTVESEDEAHYGMRFVNLDVALAQRVEQTVTERTEGRAIEWTLPVMPSNDAHPGLDGTHDFVLNPNFDTELRDAADPFAAHTSAAHDLRQTDKVAQVLAWWQRARHQKNMWIGAAAGLFVGLSIALLAAGRKAPAPVAHKQVPPAHHLDFTDDMHAGPGIPLELAAESPVATAPAPKAAPVATKPVPALVPAAQVQKKPSAQGLKPASQVTQRVKELAAQTAASHRTEKTRPYIEGGANRATLILTLDKTAQTPTTLWMADPRRLVVDVPGAHAAAQGKMFDLDHPLVSRVRVGQHGNKVRFVAETASAIRSDISTRVVGNTIQIELRRP